MSRIAFYGGVMMIVIGVVYWILRPASPAQKNIIKIPGGFEFELNTPAFALVVLGIVLMLISQRFPGPKPSPETKDFDISGTVVKFGCEQNATATVTYDAPPGWRIISATPHVGTATDGVKNQNASVTKQDDHQIEAKASFRGRDLDFGINCPTGGQGQAQLTGKIQRD